MTIFYTPLSVEACKDRLEEHSTVYTLALSNFYHGTLLRDGYAIVHEYLPQNRIRLHILIMKPSFKKRVSPDCLFCLLKELSAGTKIEVTFDYGTRYTLMMAFPQALLITMGHVVIAQQLAPSFQPVCFGLFFVLLPLTYYGYGRFRRWQGRQAEAWMLSLVEKIFLASPV